MKLKDFFISESASDDTKHLSDRSRDGFLQLVAEYAAYGKKLERQVALSEIAEELGVVAEAAEAFTLNEADDWFDQITVKRNMKELKKFSEDFKKTSDDAVKLENRMMALYEDMGHILNRYFEINDLSEYKDMMNESVILHDGPKRLVEVSSGDVKKLVNKQWFINLVKTATHTGEMLVHYTNDDGEDEWELISASHVNKFKSHFRNFHVIFNGKTKEWVIK